MQFRLTRPRDAGCLSDLALDELFADELELATKERAEAHLATCEACRARLAALAADQAAFAADAPPFPIAAPRELPALAPRPADVHPITSARRARGLPFAGVLSLVAAAAIFFVLRGSKPIGGDGTRTKGGGHLGLYVQRAGAVSLAAPGEAVHPGETLQFTYTTHEPRYLAVISVDGAKRASVYYPLGSRSERVQPGRDVELSNSTVLDATLGAEVAYGLFCDAAIELEATRAAFEASPGAPPIPPGCTVDAVSFVKEPSR